MVCSLVSATGGEELAWCEIRRGGDASTATIRNLRYFRLVGSCRVLVVRIAGEDAFFRWFDGLAAVSCLVRLVAADANISSFEKSLLDARRNWAHIALH